MNEYKMKILHWIIDDKFVPFIQTICESAAPYANRFRILCPENETPKFAMLTENTTWGNSYYEGPCPPSGTHNYKFKLYALDISTLGLATGANKTAVETAMDGNILEQDILTGTFTAP